MSLSLNQKQKTYRLTTFLKSHEFGAFITTSLGLVAVGFLGLALAPNFAPEDTYAEGSESKLNVNIAPTAAIAMEYYDPSSSTYVSSDTLDIELSPSTFKTGALRVTASTNSPAGMKLSMNDSDSNNALIEQGDSQSSPAKPYISSITSNTTIADATDSGNAFSNNTWGYAFTDTTVGSSAAPAVPLTYSQIPTTETLLRETETLGDNAYILTAAVRAGRDMVAGIYKDQLTFTVIANPLPRVYSALHTMNNKYMQDADLATVCADVITPLPTATQLDLDGSHKDDANYVPSITMKDQRDEQVYTIRKLADGNCWMTDNLAFGVNGGTITADNTDNPAKTSLSDYNITSDLSGFTVSYIVARILTTDATKVDGTDSFASYDNGGNASGTITSIDNSGSKLGAMYNYCAATGGTACTDSGTTPTGSICPRGWTLPTYANPIDTSTPTSKPDKSYERMLGLYGVTSSAAGYNKLIANPLNFVRAGYANSGKLYERFASGYGNYWSASPYPWASSYAYDLRFGASGAYQSTQSRYAGLSVRCVSS